MFRSVQGLDEIVSVSGKEDDDVITDKKLYQQNFFKKLTLMSGYMTKTENLVN